MSKVDVCLSCPLPDCDEENLACPLFYSQNKGKKPKDPYWGHKSRTLKLARVKVLSVHFNPDREYIETAIQKFLRQGGTVKHITYTFYADMGVWWYP